MKTLPNQKELVHSLVNAARRGDVKRCTKLVAIGVPLNVSNREKRTPLVAAVEKGHLQVAKLLLKNGAEPDWAIPLNDPFLPGDNALTISVRAGNETLVRELLLWKADPSFEKTSGGTPLSYAASYGHLSIVKRLLKASAPLTNHVLDGAVRKGHEKTVAALLKAGADPNRPNKVKETLVSTAAGNGHLQIVKMLVKHGADLESAVRGLTPLMWAIIRRHDDIARWLIAQGVKLETRDNGGRTALFHAVANQRLDVAKELIAAGAVCRTADSKGRTLEQVARQLRDKKLVDLLR